jgi:Holliday junction DNA helicase RuvA
MFAYIKGQLISANSLHAIIEAGGIGYQVFISTRGYSQLPQPGKTVQLHTSFIVRELSQTLYGFLYSEERDLFETLINVSGIGPKMALSLIGHLSTGELQMAVMRHDLATRSRVPGIGKKTAERLIVELKDKLAGLPTSEPEEQPARVGSQSVQDAMLALINLGYNHHTAQKAIKQGLKELSEDADAASLITVSLKHV